MQGILVFMTLASFLANEVPGSSSFCHIWNSAGTLCESCLSNRYLHAGKCVQDCPTGFMERTSRVRHAYRNSIGGMCIKMIRGTIAVWGEEQFGGSSPAWLPIAGAKGIYPSSEGFTITYHNNEVSSWGGSSHTHRFVLKDVRQVFANKYSFAAIYGSDSNVSVWGLLESDIDVPHNTWGRVQTVFTTEGAFAAVTDHHVAFSWGSYDYGGCMLPNATNESAVNVTNNNRTCLATTIENVSTVFSTARAFAALRSDKTVFTWGSHSYGGCDGGLGSQEFTCKPATLQNVTTIYSSYSSFAALKDDGTVVVWGNKNTGGCNEMGSNDTSMVFSCLPNRLYQVRTIFTNGHSFMAMRHDGSVVGWGLSTTGLVAPGRLDRLGRNVKGLFHSGIEGDNYIALRYNGTCYLWGDRFDAQTKMAVASSRGIAQIVATRDTFFALSDNGTVSAWPSNNFRSQRASFKIVKMYASSTSFVGIGDGIDSLSLQEVSHTIDGVDSGPKAPSVFNVYDVFSTVHAFVAMLDSCNVGEYKTKRHGMNCSACPRGKYYSSDSAYRCLDCSLGRFSNELSLPFDCPVCSSGAYQNELGQPSCKVCPFGRYLEDRHGRDPSVHMDLENCSLCPVGKFLPAEGAGFAENCMVCVSGTYSLNPGQKACSKCPAGRYLSDNSDQPALHDNLDDCVLCALGKYTQNEGQSECTECPEGKFGNIYSAPSGSISSCRMCEVGFFQNASGGQMCKPCDEGEYAPSPGSTACQRCETGQYGAKKSQKECKICLPGTYQDGRGGVSCKKCPVNTFNPKAGSSLIDACTLCGEGQGTMSRVGAFSRIGCLCVSGYLQHPTKKGECIACPDVGAACIGTNATVEHIYTIPGYWRSSKTSWAFLKCPVPSNCPGGYANVSIDRQCSNGHGGPLCKACVAPYTHVANTCVICTQRGEHLVGWIVLSLFFFLSMSMCLIPCFSSGFLNNQRVPTLNNKQPRQELEMATRACLESWSARKQGTIKCKVTGGAQSEKPINDKRTECMIKTRIYVELFQITSIVRHIYDVPWPTAFIRYADLLEWSNVFLPKATCTVSFITAFYLHTIVLPLLGILAIVVAWRLAVTVWPHEGNGKRNTYHACSIVWTWLLFLYPGVSSTVFRILDCTKIDGQSYLSADASFKCWEGSHALAAFFATFLFVVFLIGFPVFSARLLFLLKRKGMRYDETSIAACGQLYMPYKSSSYYFGVLNIVKTGMLTGMFLIITPHEPIQVLLALLLALGAYSYLLNSTPYEQPEDNKLHSLSSLQLFMDFLFALIFRLDDLKVNSPAAMGVFLVLTNVCVAVAASKAILCVVADIAPEIGVVWHIFIENFCCACFSRCSRRFAAHIYILLNKVGFLKNTRVKIQVEEESSDSEVLSETPTADDEEDIIVPETNEKKSAYVITIANEIAEGALTEAKHRKRNYDRIRRRKRLAAKDRAEGFEEGFGTEFWKWWGNLSREEQDGANEKARLGCERMGGRS